MTRNIQINLNHARQSQDLLLRTMEERTVDLAVIVEPHSIPNDDRRHGSAGWVPTVAITWQGASHDCVLMDKGQSYFGVLWNNIVVIDVYFSPSKTLGQFGAYLNKLDRVLDNYRGKPLVLLGDLNARSLEWDVRSNTRGDMLADWAAA